MTYNVRQISKLNNYTFVIRMITHWGTIDFSDTNRRKLSRRLTAIAKYETNGDGPTVRYVRRDLEKVNKLNNGENTGSLRTNIRTNNRKSWKCFKNASKLAPIRAYEFRCSIELPVYYIFMHVFSWKHVCPCGEIHVKWVPLSQY